VGIKVFGSCANGIAIKDSDIDIAIDNSIVNYFSYCKEEDQVVFSLQWLEGILSSFPCMKNVKLIKGASVPIIKLTLDTSERF
jgi:DNA polymerase sigma